MTTTITPYDFQWEYIDKATPLDEGPQEGFLNADDMGTGKTIQAQFEILRIKEMFDKPLKVLASTIKSGIDVWGDWAGGTEEYAALLPGFEIIVPRKRLTEAELGLLRDRSTDVLCITNHAQLRINPDYQRTRWDIHDQDEADILCNWRSQQSKATRRIKATIRRAFTGTPVDKHPADLFGILKWLYPKRFTSYWRFFEEYVEYHEEYGAHGSYKVIDGVRNEKRLRALLAPIFIRRMKEEVLPDLPEKYRSVIHVDLTAKQRRAYNQMRDDALAWVGEYEDEVVPAPLAISKLGRLRQFSVAHATAYEVKCPKCKGTGKQTAPVRRDQRTHRITNKPGEIERCSRCRGRKVVVKVDLQEPSSKLDAVMEVINSTNVPIVVFTQYLDAIEMLGARLDKAKIRYSRIIGDDSATDRGKAVRAFQSGKTRVFVAQIKAGGASITLTRASTAIFIDRSWAPRENAQAEDRLHRDGQKNAVQVISIQARNTVDSQVEARLKFKRSIIRKILEDA